MVSVVHGCLVAAWESAVSSEYHLSTGGASPNFECQAAPVTLFEAVAGPDQVLEAGACCRRRLEVNEGAASASLRAWKHTYSVGRQLAGCQTCFFARILTQCAQEQ